MIQHGRDKISQVLIRFYLVPDLPIYAKWLIRYMKCNPRVLTTQTHQSFIGLPNTDRISYLFRPSNDGSHLW